MSRLGAERALDLLTLVLREKHQDHCGGPCRVDLDGFPHDCCYACNLAQEIGQLYERRSKDFGWSDDEVQKDRDAYAKAWGSLDRSKE